MILIILLALAAIPVVTLGFMHMHLTATGQTTNEYVSRATPATSGFSRSSLRPLTSLEALDASLPIRSLPAHLLPHTHPTPDED